MEHGEYVVINFLWPYFLLLQLGRRVEDLFEDLRDGHNLISLLEVLSGDQLVKKKKKKKHFTLIQKSLLQFNIEI